jgi:hypothetical protein
MTLDIRKFASLPDLNAYVKGRLRGSTDLVQTPSSLFLHGKTLIFTAPAATVTFAASPAAAQVPLTMAQVKAQIEAQAATVLVTFINGRLELRVNAGTVTVNSTGTANGLLGFDATTPSTAKPMSSPGGAAPSFISLVADGAGSYILSADV